jgi:hypothetical protein
MSLSSSVNPPQEQYDLFTPSSCSSTHQIPHSSSTLRNKAHLIQDTTGETNHRRHISPNPSTRTTCSAHTTTNSRIRIKQRVSSTGTVKGFLLPVATGKNGAIPVPGSLNLVNFSIDDAANSPPPLIGHAKPGSSVAKCERSSGNRQFGDVLMRPEDERVILPDVGRNVPGGGSIYWRLSSRALLSAVGLLSKGFLKLQRSVEVHGLDGFLKILESEKRDRGILTGIDLGIAC